MLSCFNITFCHLKRAGWPSLNFVDSLKRVKISDMSVCSPFEGNFDDIIGRLLMRFSTMAPFIRARLTCKGIRQKCFPLNIWSSMSRVIFMPLFKKRVYRMCVSMYQWKNEWAILLIMNHWPPLGRAAIFSLNPWMIESLNQRPTFGQGAAGESQGAGTGWTELGCCTVLVVFLLYMIRFF